MHEPHYLFISIVFTLFTPVLVRHDLDWLKYRYFTSTSMLPCMFLNNIFLGDDPDENDPNELAILLFNLQV